jgi:hypothetical protein
MSVQMGRRAFLGAGVLIAGVPPTAMARAVAPQGTLLPQEQRAFAAAVDRAWVASRSQKDPAARAEIVARRGADLRAALGRELDFEGWLCTLTYMAPLRETTLVAIHVLGSKGRARATIGNFSFRDDSDVRLDPASPLAEQARDLRLEEQVIASGVFKPDEVRGCASAYGKKPSTSEVEFEIPLFTVRFTALVPYGRRVGTARDTEQAIKSSERRDEG